MQDLEFRQLVERVKLRSSIEVIVGERVQGLRQRGALHWARCPFHEERTPSFAVDPRKGTWHCYGACGEGGDVLSFVQRFDGLSFLDALRLLARQAGEEVPERAFARRDAGAESALEQRYALLAWAGELYRRALRTAGADRARTYLSGRGLSEATLQTFGIGWAPAEGAALVQVAEREKKPLELLIETGLARRGNDGGCYDFFRGRILIPIRDRLGRIVGFGGRVLPGAEETAKYINTPETPLFHKGRLIFGLDLAAAEVRRTNRLLIVEGYTDVMAAHQAGIRNAVAVLGTATTDEHAALIRRSGARHVTLGFDGDEAGRRASARALLGLLRLPLVLRIAELPEGKDPGDLCVTEAGARDCSERIEAARDWFDWSLDGLRGKRGPELSAAVEERFRLLERLENVVERSARIVEMARSLALPEADLREQWKRFERSQQRPARAPEPATARPAPPARPEPGLEQAFALLISALLLDNSLVPLYAPLAPHCPEGELATILRVVLELHENDDSDQPIDAQRVIGALLDHPARARVVALENAAATAESPEVLAADQEAWIAAFLRAGEVRALQGQLSALDSPQDAAFNGVLERLHQKLREGRVPAPAASRARSH